MALTDVAQRFATASSPARAADAYAQVAELHAAREHTVAATRAAAIAQVHAATCTGVSTPAVARIIGLGLSPRELELTRLAAAGRSNRDIADELTLSLRTVENHLSRAYRKLEVSGRADLRTVLGVAGNPP